MNAKTRQIAEAALRCYSRNGVRRTTMTDIANEAEVTRQTVYNTYPNTDAVLRAAIKCYIDTQWQKIRQRWRHCSNLDEKLDVLLQHFALEPWEFIHSSPAAAELAGGYNDAGRAEIYAAREGFRDEVAGLFMAQEARLKTLGTSAHDVADFIGAAIEGIKYNSDTREAMLIAIATLKASLLALASAS